MPDAPFQFDVFRLIIADEETLFAVVSGEPITADDHIRTVLAAATRSGFDQIADGRKSRYRWSIREYVEYPNNVLSLVLARSVLERSGKTVTTEGIQEAVSEFSPPPADELHFFFNMNRHLVAVEFRGDLRQSDSWRTAFHRIIDAAAAETGFRSTLRLEPVPQEFEILRAFRSFSVLTRLRVHLRLPNPETHWVTERLRKEMEAGGIRDYVQDMRNLRGISQSEDALPYASAAMAEKGYKRGEVMMEGLRDGRRSRVRTGARAARGTVEQIRDFVRGVNANLRTREARAAVEAIMQEIDRLVEPPSGTSNDA